MNKKENAKAVLNGSQVKELPFMPITMMFASDLISQPYRQYAFEAAVQAEAQMRVAELFGTSHVSVISDPAVEATDQGASVLIAENTPPAIREDEALLGDKTALKSYRTIRPEDGKRMSNRLEAVRLLKKKAGETLLVEGWVEGPCAEASDLRGINHLMMDFIDDPVFVEELLDKVTEQAIAFALAQIDAGADIIGVGDAASSLIGPDLYKEFLLPGTKRYVEAIHKAGGLVRLHICGNTNPLFLSIAELGVDMIDLDSMADIAEARRILGPEVTIAGNLDPVSILKDSQPEIIMKALEQCRLQAGNRYIVGAGCEVPRGTPFVNLKSMAEFSKSP